MQHSAYQPNTLSQPPASPLTQTQRQKSLSPQQARRELTQAIHGSNEVLTQATTAFKLFPNTVTVDRTKLTVTKRAFWRTAEVMSIRIEDILNVTASVGPLLGTLMISSRVSNNNEKPYIIAGFWREDALRVKRITQGYVIALQRGIDCSSLPPSELAVMLDQIGADDHS